MNVKNLKITAVVTALFLSLSSLSIAQTIDTELDSVSYTMGILFAKSIKQQGVKEVNEAAVARGIREFLDNNVKVIPEAECEKMYRSYMTKVAANKKANAMKEGQDYLLKNAAREGVVVTESGLQYEVITQGAGGPKPKLNDKVKTHYHGTNIDGSVFDSSVDRNEPISFPVSGVIKGWTEALQLMSVGDKFRLVIPSELAYGSRGAGASIAPNATLIFEVELLGINE